MDAKELRRLKPELASFLDRYAPLFGRPEAQGHARRFVHGLLLGGDRRSVENIAEAIDGCVVRSLQSLITAAPWDATAVLPELRRHVAAEWGDPDGVLTVDETGFPKEGQKSVGVKRQYSGTLGRTENCQVGVFLGYFAAKGHTLLDRRLFLPDERAADRPRRDAAGVPPGVIFRTKPELALAMVADAAAAGVPSRWAAGDSVYGDSPTFCQGVRALGKWYALDVSAIARVWTAEPEVTPPGHKPARGRTTTKPRAVTRPVRVDEAVAGLPASAWRRVAVAEGSQGPLVYEYAEVRVWFSEEGLPSGPERLLVRRSLGQEPEVKYHRTNAPAAVGLAAAAGIRSKRWSIEQDFQNAKRGSAGWTSTRRGGGSGGTTTPPCPSWPCGSWPASGRSPGGKSPGLTVPKDHRTTLSGIFHRLRTGCPWRDLPGRYGPWQTVFERFYHLRRSGRLAELLAALQLRLNDAGLLDHSLYCVDGTSVRATRAAGAGGKNRPGEPRDHALGMSRGGFGTKVHLVCDANRLPLAAVLTPGQRHESTQFEAVMAAVRIPGRRGRPGPRPAAVAGDKGYRDPHIRAWLRRHGVRAVIPRRSNQQPDDGRHRFDKPLYRKRAAVEQCAGWLKENRAVGTRFDKLAVQYLGMVHLAMIRRYLRALAARPDSADRA